MDHQLHHSPVAAPPPAAPDAASETFPPRFESWEALEAYIAELGASTYQVFHKRSSTTIAQRHAAVAESRRRRGKPVGDPQRELAAYPPAEWVMYQRVFLCTCGFRNARRGSGQRTHRQVRSTGCTAKITATVQFDRAAGAHFLKAQLRGAHNHPCDRERYYSYAENRRFAPELLREMAALHARGAKARELLHFAARYERSKTGMDSFYRIADVRNALRRYTAQLGQQVSDASASDSEALSGDDDDDGDDDELSGSEQETSPVPATAAAAAAALAELGPRERADAARGELRGQRREDAQHAPRKRRADAISRTSGGRDAEASLAALPPRQRKALLSEIEVTLNAPFSYALAGDEIEAADIAVMQQVPHTISGFVCEVVLLSPHFRADDVAFVLPRFAIAGCESAIIEASHARSLPSAALGVNLTVELPTSGAKAAALLTARQLAAMTRFHLARQQLLGAKKALEWIDAATYPSRRPAAPFDDVFDYSKELVRRSLSAMPLTKTVVRGRVSDPVIVLGFTDTVVGASVAKFASDASLDLECMKAVLLHMHSRFYEEAGIICPTFVLEAAANPRLRTRKANTYGAFKMQKQCVMGVLQLQSQRWGSFFLDCARNKCFLFQSKDGTAELDELRERVQELLAGFNVSDVAFACSSCPTATPVSTANSGIFALLFLELFVLKVSWERIPFDAVEYFRIRYLMQAIRVLSCQDIHDIAGF